MLVDILGGSQLGPEDGWFRKAVAQTRFTWDATRSAFDKDGDGAISEAEFGGSDADFARLDRDRDGSLTAPDFDFSPHALTPSPGASLYYRADARRQRQGHEGRVRGPVPVPRRRRARLPLAGRVEKALRTAASPANPGRPTLRGLRRQPSSKGCSARRSARSSPAPSSTIRRPTSRSRPSTGRRNSRSRSSSDRSRSCSSSATSPAGRSGARRGTSRSSTVATRTARPSSWSTSARPTRPTAGRWRATTAWASRFASPRNYGERVEIAQTLRQGPRSRLPDAGRHDRRRRRGEVQRDARPVLPDRP